jgi:cytochrome c peroxidase
MKFYIISPVLAACFLLMACESENPSTPEPPATYDATPYTLDLKGMPVPPFVPADNQLTVQGVKLGQMLFNEKMLSKGNAQSCADCHAQSTSFSDKRRFSIGVDGLPGRRQAMPLVNLLFVPTGGPGVIPGFFWDGRSVSLRDQALRPIQDTLEMHETLPNMVAKLQASKTYRDHFVRAFGSDTITADRVARALEQFELTLNSVDSKFDRVQRAQATYTPQEQRGRDLFFREMSPMSGGPRGAECFHCHGGPSFSNFAFSNNGLDDDASITDIGRQEVTNNPRDRARFKTPSLRNIAASAPYMHDGRFTTLREVLNHYNTGIKISATLDPALDLNRRPGGLGLRPDELDDLEAFLHTLTDSTFIGR